MATAAAGHRLEQEVVTFVGDEPGRDADGDVVGRQVKPGSGHVRQPQVPERMRSEPRVGSALLPRCSKPRK